MEILISGGRCESEELKGRNLQIRSKEKIKDRAVGKMLRAWADLRTEFVDSA